MNLKIQVACCSESLHRRYVFLRAAAQRDDVVKKYNNSTFAGIHTCYIIFKKIITKGLRWSKKISKGVSRLSRAAWQKSAFSLEYE